ncbi:NmrA domain-containing protein [Fusarium falciforme]|uniref:NmrA domain-containing protein n=1 Tax=Fusarium falciforme TaxID=195108 RepID=UPI0023005A28|nr:NmrA domain-containing protein [Fusarium falciforme]WAO87501.1 NmrA domain-containing protein [Fusarium falciforme]
MLVLIPGISGNMGTRLAKAAVSRGLSVRGLGRDASKVPEDVKLESFVTSTSYYDIPAIEKAVQGVDAIICAYMSTDVLVLDGHLILLRAAERAGVKIFFSASWNNDWTRNKFGDFEHYDAYIAFHHQAALTSPIKPVYIFNGFFDSLLFTAFGPGGFDTTGEVPTLKYWGDEPNRKFWWIAQEDAAAWTIELLFNKDVQEGKGGVFRFRSGEVTLDELAAAYHKATGTPAKVVRAGNVEDIAQEVQAAREEKGLAGYWDYAAQAVSLNVARGVWDIPAEEVTNLDHAKKPTALEEYLKQRFQSA